MAQSSNTAAISNQFAMSIAAAQQALGILRQQNIDQVGNELSVMTQNVVMNIDRTLEKIDGLRSLQEYKARMLATFAGNVPPALAMDAQRADLKIQEGYTALSKLIQFTNDSIGRFNHSPAAQVPRLLNIVSAKRHQLNLRLEALKNHRFISAATESPSTSRQDVAQNHSKIVDKQETGSKESVVSSTPHSVRSQSVHQSTLSAVSSSSSSKSTGAETGRPTANQSSSQRQPATGQQKPTAQGHLEEKREQSPGMHHDVSGQGRLNSVDQIRERIARRVADDNKNRQMQEKLKVLIAERTKTPADSTSPDSTKK